MKVILAALSLMFLALQPTSAAETGAVPRHETPQPLPEIVFTDENGERRMLGDWRGKVILLNIWATWCGPCRTEMPTLDRLQQKLGGDRFEVLALSIDRAGSKVVRKFFDETGIEHLGIFVDETMKAARDLKIYGLPGSLLIGPNGRELGRLIGPAEWDTPQMIDFFENVITESTGEESKP